jgi:hypothetical protein
VPLDATLGEIIQANPWVIPVAIILVVVVILVLRWVARRLPAAEWRLSFDADAHQESHEALRARAARLPAERFFGSTLWEKIALVSLVSIIFSQILPGVQATIVQVAIGVAYLIVVNSALSHWLARRGTEWRSAAAEFAVMVVANLGAVLLAYFLLPRAGGSINLTNTLFFVLLLTLIVVLFDRYRPVYRLRAVSMKDVG